MKYLKLSSVLVALFFAVGCGSKSVEKDGNTTTKTEIVDPADTPPEETIAAEDGNLPEGGFMPNGGSIDGDGYNNGDGDGVSGSGYDGNNQYAQGNEDDGANGGPIKVDSLTTIYFDFDRYDIRSDMKEYVRANADYIKEQNIKAIVLQGNTDEFGGDEYNTALGLKRALSVRDALVLQGLSRNMFSTISYGMHKPVCREKTTECYAKNRRTDLVEKQ